MNLCVSTLPACATSSRSRSYSRGVSFTSSPAHGDDPAHQVDREIADPEDRPLALLLQTVAKRGAQPGEQLVDAERLGDVVVGAEIERFDLVRLVGPAGQHDDRNVGDPIPGRA